MSDKKTHIDFIKIKGFKHIQTYGIYFQPEEIIFLTKFFNWGLGLVYGELIPISEEQELLVNIFNTHIKQNNIPPKHQEQWYTALNDYQKTWTRYYYVEQLKDKINDFTVSKDPQNIYTYEEDVEAAINEKKKSTNRVPDPKFCSNCGNFKGSTEHLLCSSCRIAKPKKEKLKRGSITTNRTSFSGRKWNDDKHRDNDKRSSLGRDY